MSLKNNIKYAHQYAALLNLTSNFTIAQSNILLHTDQYTHIANAIIASYP